MTRSPVRSACVLVVAVSLLAGVARASLNQGATPDAEGAAVFPPQEIVHGATLGEWNARQWQWTASFPAGVNPGQDVSGTTCGYGQSGPVFFVPRNFPPCVVAEGVAIFVPVVGAQCSTAEAPPYFGRDEEALRACAAADVDRYTGLAVSVDGRDLPDIGAYRASSPLFPLPLPANNVLGAPAGMASAVADGYQLILAPLPPGEHEVVVHAELTDGTVLPDKVMRITVIAPTAGDQATPDLGASLATPLA